MIKIHKNEGKNLNMTLLVLFLFHHYIWICIFLREWDTQIKIYIYKRCWKKKNSLLTRKPCKAVRQRRLQLSSRFPEIYERRHSGAWGTNLVFCRSRGLWKKVSQNCGILHQCSRWLLPLPSAHIWIDVLCKCKNSFLG